MIGALKGTVLTSSKNPLILLVGGVGYAVYVPSRYLTAYLKDTSLLLYVYTYVREDALDLYGFLTEKEHMLFTSLLTVSGVGPKTALLVMDNAVEDITAAIRSADVSFFTAIPRLGKKNAQKIIIELKQKIGSGTDLDLGNAQGSSNDLIDGLMHLGFSRHESAEAIRHIPKTVTADEEKLRYVLKFLKKQT